MLQGNSATSVRARFKQRCLIDISRHSLRLHILAPLPTTAPESAGLCAFGLGFIVSPSLKNSDGGLVAPGFM